MGLRIFGHNVLFRWNAAWKHTRFEMFSTVAKMVAVLQHERSCSLM